MLNPQTWSQLTPHSLRKYTAQRYIPMGPTGRIRASFRPASRTRRICMAISCPSMASEVGERGAWYWLELPVPPGLRGQDCLRRIRAAVVDLPEVPSRREEAFEKRVSHCAYQVDIHKCRQFSPPVYHLAMSIATAA